MRALHINGLDNVAVALCALSAGEGVEVAGREIVLAEDVPAGHKLALCAIAAGAPIIKYGFRIGLASASIPQGGYVHSHNMRTALAAGEEFSYVPSFVGADGLPQPPVGTFRGFRRADGSAGTRNEIWIIPLVGCVNRIARAIAVRSQALVRGAVEGIFAFEHPYGCSQLGEDLERTQRTLAGLVRNPNAGGVLVLGLGCENNQMAEFKRVLAETGGYDGSRVRFLVAQEEGDEISAGFAQVAELAERVSREGRDELPVSLLRVGLKCGGSDAFSGLTANPLLGWFSDALIAGGGSCALTEIPEMFGAEGIILNRCATPEMFARGAGLVREFRDYYVRHGEPVSENPSPGNRAGGITTLEEKSLGCVQKGGQSPVVDILAYGQGITRPGLSIVEGPGNDLVAVTNLAAAGCQIILFTTGLGNPYGGPVPTLKVSTNSKLAVRKGHWIDFNAGCLLEGRGMQEVGREFFAAVVAAASGGQVRNEENDCREIAIFKSGVTL